MSEQDALDILTLVQPAASFNFEDETIAARAAIPPAKAQRLTF
jgi:hypothetical protein